MSLDPATTTRREEGVGGTVTGKASPLAAALPEWKGNERYAIVSRIGEGGMGVVYEAFDRERHQTVALKTLLRFSPGALVRFKQEFRTLADVHHRNLVRLHELVVNEGTNIFFTMELVNGSDFATYVQRPDAATQAPSLRLLTMEQTRANPPTSSASSVRPASIPCLPNKVSPADMDRLRHARRQLVGGVHALHGAGKLHRDIKPSNVLVTPAGRVVILDFGVATELSSRMNEPLTEADEIVGTIRYMAPEQALGEALTPAADWYSAGVMLYEALVGSAPFVGSMTAVIGMKTSRDPVPAGQCVKDVPPDLDDLCQALLRREAGERPTAPEILSRLGGSRSFRPVSSPLPPSVPGRAKELVGRERHLATLRDAFEQVRAGRPLTLLLAGASGMGKSAAHGYCTLATVNGVVLHFLLYSLAGWIRRSQQCII